MEQRDPSAFSSLRRMFSKVAAALRGKRSPERIPARRGTPHVAVHRSAHLEEADDPKPQGDNVAPAQPLVTTAREPLEPPSPAMEPPSIEAPKANLPVTLERTGEFRPHPLLAPELPLQTFTRIRPQRDGIASNLLGPSEQPQTEADLIIGLDFGTSTVKVVIRDRFRGQSFAVPFTDAIDNPYLLPSRVYQSDGAYSLDEGEQARRDLKLRLMNCEAASPVTEFIDACAFLALVLRHCRGWLLDTHAALYKNARINWSLNLGLPAASYEDDKTVRLFRRLAWAAANLAARPGARILPEDCDHFRLRSIEALSRHLETSGPRSISECEFEFEDVDVVPEVAAQIYGYVTSSRWDWKERPMMMLVDIGAGTVDAAFFSFTRYVQGKRRFAFFANDVQPNGVMNLHRARVDWLRDAATANALPSIVHGYLAAVRFPTDRTAPVPQSYLDYLPGYRVHCAPGVKDIDTSFFRERHYRQVATCCGNARRAGVAMTQLRDVPCFVTGGGSRLDIYSRVIEGINGNNTDITLQRLALTRISDDLHCPGLREADFDRLSVAYGLSYNGADDQPLGECIREIEVRSPTTQPERNWRSTYVDKDMV